VDTVVAPAVLPTFGALRYRRSMSETERPFQLESALEALESLVASMEKGDLPLEDALQCYERGMQLTRACQKALDEAEQKVKVWSTQDDTLEEGFAPPGPQDLGA
jgi:exodeoxyribonuclease VII small subunit